jgi:hypothetical protein
VFREVDYVLRPDIKEKENESFIGKAVEQIKGVVCFFANKLKRVYGLEIRRLDYRISKLNSPRIMRKSLEMHIRRLFARETCELGFIRIRSLPEESVHYKKAKRQSRLEHHVKRAIENYKKKGFEIPDAIHDGEYQRKEKGSILDFIYDPVSK